MRFVTKMNPPQLATMHVYPSPASAPQSAWPRAAASCSGRVQPAAPQPAAPRVARTHNANVSSIALIATLSLSKPPATERIRCAGRIAMKKAAATPAFALAVAS